MSKLLCLKWNNHTNVMKELKHLLSIEAMVDVTLACDGLSLKAHKLVLSACSPYFRSLFLENPCKHPIVIMKDVKYTDCKAIIDFMYCGEVNIDADQLSTVLKIARTLKVKGLGEVEYENNLMENKSRNNSNCESENKTGANSSRCVVDTSFSQEQSTSDESNIRDNEPEIKQEIISVEDIENDDNITDYQPKIKQEDVTEDMNHSPTVHLESHGTNSLRSQPQQLLSIPSLETSSESNTELHRNCSTSNLASAASAIKLSDVLLFDDEAPRTSTNIFSKTKRKALTISHVSSDSPDDLYDNRHPQQGTMPNRDNPESGSENNSVVQPSLKRSCVPCLPVNSKRNCSENSIKCIRNSQDHSSRDQNVIQDLASAEMGKEILKEMEKMNKQICDMQSKVDSLHMQMKNVSNNGSLCPKLEYTPENIPVTSVELLDELNNKIKNDKEFAADMIRFLYSTGNGRSERSFILSLTKAVMSQNVAVQFSRYGRKGKKSFQTYNETLNVILAAASMKFKEADREDLAEMFGRSLAGASDWNKKKVRPLDSLSLNDE